MKPVFIVLMLLALCLIGAPVLTGANNALAADGTYNASYEAELEVVPDDICWTVYSGSMSNAAGFSNGVLLINTGSAGGNFGAYQMTGDAILNAPTSGNPWIIEARIKYGAGSSSHSARTHVGIPFYPFANWFNLLQLGEDEAFLLNGPTSKGDSASVDTDDDFHTYTIYAYSDKTVEVYYDDEETAILEGDLLYYYNTQMGIYFGDATGAASGLSYWSAVKHNAYNGICGIFLP